MPAGYEEKDRCYVNQWVELCVCVCMHVFVYVCACVHVCVRVVCMLAIYHTTHLSSSLISEEENLSKDRILSASVRVG